MGRVQQQIQYDKEGCRSSPRADVERERVPTDERHRVFFIPNDGSGSGVLYEMVPQRTDTQLTELGYRHSRRKLLKAIHHFFTRDKKQKSPRGRIRVTGEKRWQK